MIKSQKYITECPICKVKVRNDRLGNHKKKMHPIQEKKLIRCIYCKNKVHQSNLEKHIKKCNFFKKEEKSSQLRITFFISEYYFKNECLTDDFKNEIEKIDSLINKLRNLPNESNIKVYRQVTQNKSYPVCTIQVQLIQTSIFPLKLINEDQFSNNIISNSMNLNDMFSYISSNLSKDHLRILYKYLNNTI